MFRLFRLDKKQIKLKLHGRIEIKTSMNTFVLNV